MLHSLRVSALVLPISVLMAGNAAPPKPPAAIKVLGLFDRLLLAQQKTTARQAPQHVAFDLSEHEVNDYAVYALHVVPRPGLRSFTVKFFAKNYVSTLALIDFDAIERWKPGTIPTRLRPVLQGSKTIWVDCRFQ